MPLGFIITIGLLSAVLAAVSSTTVILCILYIWEEFA